MYYLAADRLVAILKKRDYIKDEHNKMVKIVMEYLLTLLINVFLASGIGYTFQIEKQLIVFSIFYSILRVSNGGNYLKLDLKKSITRWGFGIVLIRMAEIITFDMHAKWIMISLLVISLGAVLALAPYRTNKTSLPDEMKQSLRKRSVVTISVLCVVLFVGLLFFEGGFVISAIIGIFVQSLSLLPAPVVNKQIIELKTYAV